MAGEIKQFKDVNNNGHKVDISGVEGLQTALDGKAANNHTHTKSQITDFAHTHTKSQITDFAHTHTQSDVTGLSGVLNAKAGSLDGVSAGEPIYMEDILQAGVVSVCHFTWTNNESIQLADLFPTKPNSSKHVYLYPSSQAQEQVAKNQIVVCTACMHASSIVVVVLFKG